MLSPGAVVLRKEGGDEGMMVLGRYCSKRSSDLMSNDAAVMLGDEGCDEGVFAPACDNCSEWLLQSGDSRSLAWTFPVASLYECRNGLLLAYGADEGVVCSEDVATHAFGNTRHRLLGEWLGAGEYRWGG